MLKKILLAGDGGQGIQTVADIICKSAFESGLDVSHIPNYGLEQRGGVSLAFIQISDKKIVYPKFTKPDILLIMSEQARERTEKYGNKEIKKLEIRNYETALKEKNINISSYNIFFLGILAKLLSEQKILKIKQVENLLEKKISKKPGWQENKKAFSCGLKIEN